VADAVAPDAFAPERLLSADEVLARVGAGAG
jgi:hypothetical protein